MKDIFLNIANYIRFKILLNKDKLHISNDYGFKNFPRACCDKSSEILLKYLNDNGFTDFKIIQKEGNYKGYNYRHVWVENNDTVIDITADQFNGIINGISFEDVIVIGKENYFFNNIDGNFEDYNGDFLTPSDGFFNYFDFYCKFIKK